MCNAEAHISLATGCKLVGWSSVDNTNVDMTPNLQKSLKFRVQDAHAGLQLPSGQMAVEGRVIAWNFAVLC